VETTREETIMIEKIVMTTMEERIITVGTEIITATIGKIVIKIHKPFMLGSFCSNQILSSRL
jgi:hypothetical protein